MNKIINIFNYLQARWQEPSTHAALAAVCVKLHIMLPYAAISDWFTVASIFFGAMGVLQKEGDKNAG